MNQRPLYENADPPKKPLPPVPAELGWGDLLFRIASIVPFLLVTLFGLVALVGWFLVVLLGGGHRDPIWVLVADGTLQHTLPQVALVVAAGTAALAIMFLAMWAAVHGLARSSGRLFWRTAGFIFALVTAFLLLAAATRPGFVTQFKLSERQWLVTLGVLGYSLAVCLLREQAPGKGVN